MKQYSAYNVITVMIMVATAVVVHCYGSGRRGGDEYDGDGRCVAMVTHL